MAEQRISLTEQEFKGWRADPVTQVYFQVLRQWVEDLKEQWVEGVFSSGDPVVTHAANVSAVGECRLLTRLMELDFEQFEAIANGDYRDKAVEKPIENPGEHVGT